MTKKVAAKTPVAAGDEDAAAKEVAETLISLGETVHVDISLSVDELIDRAVQRLNSAAVRIAVAGIELLAAKAKCAHGEFARLCEQSTVSPRQTRYAMSIARWLLVLPKTAQCAVLRSAQPSKLRELARLDPAELEALEAEQGTDAEGLLALPRRELVAMVNKQKRDSAKQIERLVQLETALADPTSKEAWVEHTDRLHRQMDELSTQAQLRIEEMVETVQRWSTARVTAHGRRVKTYTGRVIQQIDMLDETIATARAACQAAIERIEAKD